MLPSAPLGSLPINLEHSTARVTPILVLGVLVPLALALLFPFVLLGQHLADDPATRAVIAHRPTAAIQLFLALMAFGAIFGWPLVRLAKSLAFARIVAIDRARVVVSERGLFHRGTWSEPLVQYAGVAHRVRTSLSGVRHELILVHRNPSRSILLDVSQRIAPEDAGRVALLLGLAEISSREAFNLNFKGGVFGPAEPQPRLGIARTLGPVT